MRVHATDQLFGLEAFSRPIQTDLPENRTDPAGTIVEEMSEAPSSRCESDLPDGIAGCADVDGPAVLVDGTEMRPGDLSLPVEVQEPVKALRSLLNRRVVLGLVLFTLVSVVGMSMFTLAMKTRKKAVSYELAHQTKLFKRMSKHRAIYELEYAYLRTSSPIQEEFARQGWREITPHDLTYIPVKKPVVLQPGGLSW
jgi:hypothetical protein